MIGVLTSGKESACLPPMPKMGLITYMVAAAEAAEGAGPAAGCNKAIGCMPCPKAKRDKKYSMRQLNVGTIQTEDYSECNLSNAILH